MRRLIFVIGQLILLMGLAGLAYGQSTPEPVFSFDFESDPDDTIFFYDPGIIENGQLVLSVPSEADTGIVFIESPLANYALEMDYTVISGDGLVWIMLREQLTDEGFSCGLELTYAPIEGFADMGTYLTDDGCNEWNYIADTTFDAITTNQTIRLRVEAQENTYRMLADGVEVIASDDSTFTEGNTFLRILGGSEVIIDNVAVFDLDAVPVAVVADNATGSETADDAPPAEATSGGLFGDADTSSDGGLFGDTDTSGAEPTAASGGLFGDADTSGAGPTAASGGLFGDADTSGAGPTAASGGLFGDADTSGAEPTAASGGLFGDADTNTSQPVAPAETGPCIVSVGEGSNVGVYTGPSSTRTIIRFLEEGDYTVEGQTTDDADNVWYQLNKSEAVPGQENAINQAWIPARGLTTTGGCEASATGVATAAPAVRAPATAAPAATTSSGSTTGAAPAQSATATPAAASTGQLAIGGTATVNQAAFVFNAPGGNSVDQLFPDMTVSIIGGPQQNGGQTWWRIITPIGGDGWISATALTP